MLNLDFNCAFSVRRRQNSMPGSVYDSRVPEGHYDIIKPKVSLLLRIALLPYALF